ncbi:methyltransferase [Novosphingobium sp. PC22D]|nr:methyltransferase [Novosphingobium sp. PC22D]
MSRYKETTHCRVGGKSDLVPILDLGEQVLTGVFPRPGETVTKGPLELAWSPSSGLLQLRHSYDPDEMYGENYGYRSGLNQSMVDHLSRKVQCLERLVSPGPGDVVVDIGSNDCTTLKAYRTSGLERIGIDPTGEKFSAYYPADVRLVADFFSADVFRAVTGKRARIVTSIAMFYDLDDPIAFAREIAGILADDGVWHFEQSYMPSMLRLNSYDTICHEHLEYYSLGVVRTILDAAGLKILDVSMNSVNGGSFAVTATHADNRSLGANEPVVNWLLEQENRMGLDQPRCYREFAERAHQHRRNLTDLVRSLVASGRTVLGYGASTKGNVVLQFCGFTPDDIPAIAEVNPDKFGRVTPGTQIPIISEAEARARDPDYFLVLPWHFRDGILAREREYLERGGKFIFPFPEIEII